MKLQAHTALCILAPLSLKAEALTPLHTLLSPDEHERAARFHFKHHQDHFIASHAFMRLALATLLHTDPESLVFNTLPGGKPFLEDHPLNFNLSHSGELAILAVDPVHPIGVDIEIIQTTSKREIAERFFSQAEQSFLNNLPESEQIKSFFDIWSKKEALVKAIGTGIQQSLSSFTVPLTSQPETLTLDDKTWLIQTLPLVPHYASALATHPETKNIEIWQWVDETFQKVDQKKA